jgi:NADPH:quinone reductase
MRAMRFHELGGPEVLQCDEIEVPRPGPGFVLVRNRRIGLNFGDLFFLRGQYLVAPKLPDIVGMEAAGEVAAVGVGVVDVGVGDRVAYIGMGSFADYTLIRANRVLHLPPSISDEVGASFPVAALTAWHMLHTVHHLTAGEWVVVHSAAGGVGLAAVQIAHAAGARVIGTVSTTAKGDAALAHGADHVVNYSEGSIASRVLELTGGHGADLILDGVGRPTFLDGLDCLARFGHLILFGGAGGPPDPISPSQLLANSRTVSGFVLPHIYRDAPVMKRSLDAIFALVESGQLKLPLAGLLPLEEAATALTALASRQTIGKFLLSTD